MSGDSKVLKRWTAASYTTSVHNELPDLMSPSNTEKSTLAALMSAINAGSFEVSTAEYGMSPQRATVNFCRSSLSSAIAPTTPTTTNRTPTAPITAHLRSIMKLLHCWLPEVTSPLELQRRRSIRHSWRETRERDHVMCIYVITM